MSPSRVAALVRTHIAAIALACAVGVMMISSHLAFRVWMGERYQGIAPMLSPRTQDAAWYHAVIAEAIEGGKPWNAILADNKKAPYPVPDLAERIMALPGRWFGLSADQTLLGWRFVLPALLTLSIYAVSFFLTGSRRFSVVVAAACVCLPSFALTPIQTATIFFGKMGSMPFGIYDRPVHPQFEAPFLWLLTMLFTWMFESKQKKTYWILAGALVGSLAYTYVWAWTWSFALLCAFLVQSYRERRPDIAKMYVTSIVCSVFFALPSLVRLAFSLRHVEYATRLAAVFAHGFAEWVFNLPIVLALVVFMTTKRVMTARVYRFVVAGLVATFVVMNQQILTGVSLQPDHFMSLIGSSFVIWVFAWAGWSWFRRRENHEGTQFSRTPFVFGMFFFILSVVTQCVFQYRIFQSDREVMAELQPFAGVARWLREHTDQQSVVFANQNIGLLVPIYTSANLWWHFYAMAVPTDSQRIDHAALTWFSILNASASQLNAAINKDPVGMAQYWTLSVFADQRGEFMRRKGPEALQQYAAFLEAFTPSRAVRQYPVHFVLFDKREDHWDPYRLGVGERVFENERFVLYRIDP